MSENSPCSVPALLVGEGFFGVTTAAMHDMSGEYPPPVVFAFGFGAVLRCCRESNNFPPGS